MVLRDIYEPNRMSPPPSSSPPSVYFQGAPGFRPAASQPKPATAPKLEVDEDDKEQERTQQTQRSRMQRREDAQQYDLRQWLLRDEAVARCSIEQARALRQEEADLFYLDTFPCRRVELVGLLISLDVRENRTTFTLDDGSSKTLEVVYEHNIFQAFQTAQRLAAARAQQQPSPLPKYRSAYPKRPPPPAALPPYEHTPRVEIGDTVCVRARVKKRSANLQFVVDVDPVPVFPNEEARHVILVSALSSEIYPAFDQASYLASALAPQRPAAPTSSALPRTPTKRPAAAAFSSPSIQSGQGLSSELDFSDLPSSSQASSSDWASTGYRPYQLSRSSQPIDPNRISSSSCDVSGLKLRLKEYMLDATHDVWGMRGLADRSVVPPVVRWLPELSGGPDGGSSSLHKGKGRAFDDDGRLEADFSASFDVSVGCSLASAQMDTSALFAGILNTPLPSSAHPSSSAPPAPPFTAGHFQHVPSLVIYGEKVLKRVTRKLEEERRAALKAELRSARHDAAAAKPRRHARDERWFYDADGIGHEGTGADDDDVARRVKAKREREPSLTKKLRDAGWVRGKVRNLFKQCLVELEMEGEVVRVDEPAPAASLPRTDASWSPSLWSSAKAAAASGGGGGKKDDSYLFVCVPTLAPLLLHLLAVENARTKRQAATVLADGTPAPFGTPAETLHRRLQGAHEDRWHFVALRKVEDVLQECDQTWDLVEKQRGGWREVGL